MNEGKYVFSQLVKFLPKRSFDFIVMKFQGDKLDYFIHFFHSGECIITGLKLRPVFFKKQKKHPRKTGRTK